VRYGKPDVPLELLELRRPPRSVLWTLSTAIALVADEIDEHQSSRDTVCVQMMQEDEAVAV